MVMKDKLYKNHRKGKRLQPKKAVAIFGALILVGAAIAIPTYISKANKQEKQGYAQEVTSSEIEEETTTEDSGSEELSSYFED